MCYTMHHIYFVNNKKKMQQEKYYPHLVCGCQEELNNFFNLEKKPPSCFNSPSSLPCLLSPASDGLPLLPPPGQRLTLHQPGLRLNTTSLRKKTPFRYLRDVRLPNYLWWWQ